MLYAIRISIYKYKLSNQWTQVEVFRGSYALRAFNICDVISLNINKRERRWCVRYACTHHRREENVSTEEKRVLKHKTLGWLLVPLRAIAYQNVWNGFLCLFLDQRKISESKCHLHFTSLMEESLFLTQLLLLLVRQNGDFRWDTHTM